MSDYDQRLANLENVTAGAIQQAQQQAQQQQYAANARAAYDALAVSASDILDEEMGLDGREADDVFNSVLGEIYDPHEPDMEAQRLIQDAFNKSVQNGQKPDLKVWTDRVRETAKRMYPGQSRERVELFGIRKGAGDDEMSKYAADMFEDAATDWLQDARFAQTNGAEAAVKRAQAKHQKK